jgi:hypothetical protein
MNFISVALRSLRRNAGNYLIYLFTLTALSTLMWSAFVLTSFAVFDYEGGAYASNSLPALIALTLLFLMAYVNRFMLKEKSRELATYMLCGVTKSGIIKLFFTELFICGIIALVCGVIICILIFALLGSVASASAIFQSVIYYLASLIASLIITTLSMRKLEIKDLLAHKEHNETRKITVRGLIISGAVTIVLYALLMIILANASALASFRRPRPIHMTASIALQAKQSPRQTAKVLYIHTHMTQSATASPRPKTGFSQVIHTMRSISLLRNTSLLR